MQAEDPELEAKLRPFRCPPASFSFPHIHDHDNDNRCRVPVVHRRGAGAGSGLQVKPPHQVGTGK